MGVVPGSKPGQTETVTKEVLKKFDFLMPYERRADKVKVLFVRGYYLNSMGKKGQNDRNIYDDAGFIVSPDGVSSWNGNTDPGPYRRGVAMIDAPQAILYQPGLHGISRGRPYPAFRQKGNCMLLRDQTGPEYGWFAVNIHRGSYNSTSSLGCMTIYPGQWDAFYADLKGKLLKNKQADFYATVLEYQGGFPPLAGLKTISVKPGDQGAMVSWVLLKLIELGYYTGRNDGRFGPKTKMAVEEFQAEHRLEVDGVAGPETLAEMDRAVVALVE